MRLISWNVNGLRAAHKKGFLGFVEEHAPDILCLQETKASEEQLSSEVKELEGYHAYFRSPTEKKGYSGVALYSKHEPIRVLGGFGQDRFDREGRTQVAYFKDFVLFNVYFPNGKASAERLRYKMDFYEEFARTAFDLVRSGKNVIVCGDVNTAHKEIDLARPKENERTSGFLPEERDWIDRFLAGGFLDSFREFDTSPGRYTWWDLKTKARERNVGWRIDYFFINAGMRDRLTAAFIMPEIIGSDHCPIGIDVDLEA